MLVDVEARYLVDNSVWQRRHQPVVIDALTARVVHTAFGATMTCPPVLAEVGYSALNPADHARLMDEFLAIPDAPRAPGSAEVLAIQHAVFATYHRGVGAMDTLIAAYAMANDAIVLHYDRGFERISECIPGFRHEWVVPPGSLD